MRRTPVFLVLVVTLALAAVPVRASGQSRGRLTVDTLLDWRTATDPQLSPDATRVVYVSGYADKMEDTNHSNLWIVTADGKDHRPVTQGSFRDSAPRWAPDGKRIAFLSNRSGRTQIHVHWMDTGQEAQITDLQESPADIAWSPDGTQLLFTKLVPASGPAGVKLPPKPRGAKWADPPIILDRLWYRQDGQGYRPYGNTHVFVVPAAGGAPRQITSGDYDHSNPAWTRDGQGILVSTLRRPEAEYDTDATDVFAVSVRDGAYRQLTTRKGPDNASRPSPDGRLIAYTGFDQRRFSYSVTHLYVMDASGGNSRLLTGDWDRDVADPEWAADGSGIYFTSGDHGSTNLYFVPAAGGAVKAITRGAQILSDVNIGAGGRVVAVRSSPNETGDIVTFTLQQPQQATELTGVNDSLLNGVTLGDVEEITYKSFDGREIQGWIVKPPDFDASRKYPLILYIHGGPHSMYGVGFNHEFQCHAARGYVVLYTNPRGSTGYGQEFGNVIQHHYPGDDFKDLMVGVDTLIARGYVDASRMAVTGGSGGGLLSAWTVGHTDRFAAAAVQYPVINWFSFVGTADGGYGMGWRWFEKWQWEDPDDYVRRSPVTYAGNVKTPTMIITGEQDWRTPISQSEEFFRALKIRKVDTILVRVPDEPHGAVRNHITHHIAKVLHIMDWFDRYIKTSAPTSDAKR
jgi:dipeptidyl aminopeptidase/acylaminoacyl peptidase